MIYVINFFLKIRNSTRTNSQQFSRFEFWVFDLAMTLKRNETTVLKCLRIGHLLQNKHLNFLNVNG